MCASPQPCVEFPQVSVHKLIAPQVPVCRSPVPLCARIAPQRFPSFRPGPLSCCVLPVCRPQVPCPVRSTPCRSPQVPCPAVCSNRTPQIHVCRFHFGPRPSDPGLLLSLWSQTLRSTSAALRSTSAAFTLVPNPQIHVCCFHFRPKLSDPRLLLSLWSQALFAVTLMPGCPGCLSHIRPCSEPNCF